MTTEQGTARRHRWPPLSERFADAVPSGLAADQCWPWQGSVKTNGYGQIFEGGDPSRRAHYAHRLAFEAAYGPIPPGVVVMHTCDNPPCVNPAHLRLGTHRDNALDKMAKGRGRGHYTPHSTHATFTFWCGRCNPAVRDPAGRRRAAGRAA